jgi:hypothetical protein
MIEVANSADPYVKKLREARNRPAVLKTKLASVRSSNPRCLVLAFEGDTDKSAYVQWIRRLRSDLRYEPFPCGGKKQVLEFREMLRRDLGGLASRVYYFIDRDFDDHREYAPDPATTFMTDQYSVENYMVTRDVLEELLKDEFHCHAEPDIRADILDQFQRCLTEFLQSTAEINFRLFVARRMKFELQRHLPNRINHIAQIELEGTTPINVDPEQIVVFQEELSQDERSALRAEFDELDPSRRYRGKFNFLFFSRWLELLASDRRAETSKCFSRVGQPRSVNTGALNLGMFASKSSVPEGLAEFVTAIV